MISSAVSGNLSGSLGPVPAGQVGVPNSPCSGHSPGAVKHPGEAAPAAGSPLRGWEEERELLKGNEEGLSLRGHCLGVYWMGVVETSSCRALGGEEEAGLRSEGISAFKKPNRISPGLVLFLAQLVLLSGEPCRAHWVFWP